MKNNQRAGQSLIEVVIALGIGIMMIGAVVGSVILFAQTSEGTDRNQTASFLIGSFLDNISVVAESGWNKIYKDGDPGEKGENAKQFIIQSANTSMLVSGTESILAEDVTTGLVLHSKFDNNMQNYYAYDSSGSGNTLYAINSPTQLTGSSCPVGSCVQFNGTDQYLEYMGGPYNFDFNTTQEISAAAWINVVPNDTRDYWLGIDNNSTIRFRFGSDSNGYLAWNMGQTTERVYSGYVIPSGTWHHVVFTGKKESGGNIYTRVYVDGVLMITQDEGITSLPTTNREYVGAARPSTHPFNGSIDDLRIYDRALSQDEISQLYRSPIFSRYFYVDNVSRDLNQDIEDPYNSANNDPSTQKITAVIGWTTKGSANSFSVSSYITRWANDATTQADWSGGSGIGGPVTEFGNRFYSATDIDYLSTPSAFSLGVGSTTGELISSGFDTGVTDGVAINSVLCNGYVPSGGGASVRMQIASVVDYGDPWEFQGPDGTDATYYELLMGMATPIVYSQHVDRRYFRYKIFLTADALGESPVIDDITVGWNI